MFKTFIFVILMLVSGSIRAETFNECILENMKGVMGDVAARMVYKACRETVLPHTPGKCLSKWAQVFNAAIESNEKTLKNLADKAASSPPGNYVYNDNRPITSLTSSLEWQDLPPLEPYIVNGHPISAPYIEPYESANTAKESCINTCLNASAWSKKFGDCAPGADDKQHGPWEKYSSGSTSGAGPVDLLADTPSPSTDLGRGNRMMNFFAAKFVSELPAALLFYFLAWYFLVNQKDGPRFRVLRHISGVILSAGLFEAIDILAIPVWGRFASSFYDSAHVLSLRGIQIVIAILICLVLRPRAKPV